MTPDEMKALVEKTRRIDGMWSKEQITAHANRLADALEAVYDAGRRELAERFANQDRTRKAAIEELMAWGDEHEDWCHAVTGCSEEGHCTCDHSLSAHPFDR